MKQLFLGGISLGFHFYFFLAFGSLFRKILGRKEGLNRYSPLFTPVLGLFLYYGLFELLALPMTLLLVPLHVLTVVWGAALAAVGLAAAFLCGRDWVKSGKTLAEIFKKQPGIYLLAGVLVLGQMIYVAAYDLNSADAAYYVANISTSLYTDTLLRFSMCIRWFWPRRSILSCGPFWQIWCITSWAMRFSVERGKKRQKNSCQTAEESGEPAFSLCGKKRWPSL